MQPQFEEFEFSPGADTSSDISVKETWTDAFGTERAVLTGDTYEAKEVIKFDWEVTHHSFDGNRKEWIVDADSLDALGRQFEKAGYSFDAEGGEPGVDSTLTDLTTSVSTGDRIEVEYEQKNGNGHNTKLGNVAYKEDRYVGFRRDDEKVMYVKTGDDGNVGLFSPMSHAPFVGTVTSVKVGTEGVH
jgi:hypothetical protein